jgi:thiosulfate/3-mercaptopyruvate sulfurtransferase
VTRLLISAEELADDDRAVVFDCRFSLLDSTAGRRAYASGHIPGARFANLERDLSQPPPKGGAGGRHPLPDRAALAERLRNFGVDDDSTIVCYDKDSGALAGRLWWLVRWLGHADARVLDGGLEAWVAAGFETTTEIIAPSPGNFSVRASLTRTCTADDLLQSGAVLLDARDETRFRGESEPFDAVAGHIPGAVSAPFTDNLYAGKFKSADALAERFGELGADPSRETVCYCGSGVTATHNVLALLLAGYPEPVLYPGSWSDWITDPERPIATGNG